MCTFIDIETKMTRTDSSKSGIPWISAYPDLQMFENEEFFHEGLKELSKIMHKISLPSTKRRLHKLLDESITYSSLKYIANPAELIGNILEVLNLPPSSGKPLYLLLLSVNKKNIENKIRTRTQKGKQLQAYSEIRKRVIDLTDSICKSVMKSTSEQENNEENNTIEVSVVHNTTDASISDLVECNICDDDDAENLADQVLNLPKEYRPVRLSEDSTIMNSEMPPPAAINVPTLPPMLNINIANDDDDTLTEFTQIIPRLVPPVSRLRSVSLRATLNIDRANDDDDTLTEFTQIIPRLVPPVAHLKSVSLRARNTPIPNHNQNSTSYSKQDQDHLNHLMDILRQPDYSKRELPSQVARKLSTRLDEENLGRYRRLIHIGERMIKSMIEILCPGPSQKLVTKDILDIMTRKNSTQPRLMNPSTNDMYEKFSNALCKCVKASKKNTVERRFLRAVLYNAVSNKSELHYLMSQHQFTFATGNSRTTALHDFTTLCNGGLITKKRFISHASMMMS